MTKRNPDGYFGPLLDLLSNDINDDQYINDLENALREEFGSGSTKEAKKSRDQSGVQKDAARNQGKEEQIPKPRDQIDAFTNKILNEI